MQDFINDPAGICSSTEVALAVMGFCLGLFCYQYLGSFVCALLIFAWTRVSVVLMVQTMFPSLKFQCFMCGTCTSSLAHTVTFLVVCFVSIIIA